MKKLLFLMCFIMFAHTLSAGDTLRLFFVGDIMGHGGQISGALMDGGDTAYNYQPVFSAMKKVMSQANVVVGNLEVTLAGPPYTGYPQFSSPDDLAVALKEAGFNVLVTANNHALDRGKKGLERTLWVLDSLNMKHTGVFADSAQRSALNPLIWEQDGFRLALLNYTYGTNGNEVQRPQSVNYADTAQIRADHLRAKEFHPDLIITCIHWGVEYERQERPEQRLLAQFLANVGSDMVIGSHPHVVQPFAWVTRNDAPVPVIYSLGNMVSNQRDRYTDGGIIFKVDAVKENGKVSIASVGYEPFWVYRYNVSGRFQYRIIPLGWYRRFPNLFRIPAEDELRMFEFENDVKTLLPNLSVRYSLSSIRP